eukprot:scaffold1447_cov296-Prasinococcus_capsulatus_cf.AAC.1
MVCSWSIQHLRSRSRSRAVLGRPGGRPGPLIGRGACQPGALVDDDDDDDDGGGAGPNSNEAVFAPSAPRLPTPWRAPPR